MRSNFPLHIVNQMNSDNSIKKRIIMLYQRHSSSNRLFKLVLLLPIVFVGLFMISCSKELVNPTPKTSQIRPSLPGNFRLVETIKVKDETYNKELKLEKDKTYTFLFKGKKKENKSHLFLLKNDKKIAQSVVNNKYYSGLTYKCGKTDNYKLVVNRDKEDASLAVVMIGYRKKQ